MPASLSADGNLLFQPPYLVIILKGYGKTTDREIDIS
jgi:hypothetical protein